jgi:hypothetical protein
MDLGLRFILVFLEYLHHFSIFSHSKKIGLAQPIYLVLPKILVRDILPRIFFFLKKKPFDVRFIATGERLANNLMSSLGNGHARIRSSV